MSYSYMLIYGVSVGGSENVNNNLLYTFQTPLGDILSPFAKQPLEPYQFMTMFIILKVCLYPESLH